MYNYNVTKDIRQLQNKLQDLIEIRPFLNKRKQKILTLKILDLTKELKKLKNNA